MARNLGRWCGALALTLAVALCLAGAARGAEITSGGPLTRVGITPDLNCYVNHVLDTYPEFYESTACGSFVAVDGTLFGPETVPAGFYPGDGVHTPWTRVDQSPVAGSGTRADPYTVVTRVSGPPVVLRQVDRYVAGEESFRTDTTIENSSDQTKRLIFYRAGDCYLGNSDYGYGRVDGDAISCLAANGDGSKGARIEQFLPVTAGSTFFHGGYSEVWQRLRDQSVFDNTCRCDSLIDNGAGLSWVRTLGGGESATISSILTFSPLGSQPLVIRKRADRTTVGAGEAVGYTVTVTNSNVRAATLTSLTDMLPAGTTYLANSTSGDTTADPVVNRDGSITWNGPFTVPAENVFTLHYTIRVPDREGTYRNSVVGEGVDVTVVPAEDVAPVNIDPPPAVPTFDVSKIADDPVTGAGSRNGYWITVSNPTATAITLGTIIDRLPQGYVYTLASSTSLTSADPGIDGRELTWDGPFVVPPLSAVKLHFLVRTADEAGIDPNTATAELAVPVPGEPPTTPSQPPLARIEVKSAVRSAIVRLLKKVPPLGVRVFAPRLVRVGRVVPIVVRTVNPSRVPALRVRTCLRIPRGLEGAGREVCRTVPLLRRLSGRSFVVRVRATRPGRLRLTAGARGLIRTSAVTSATVRVVARPPKVTG